MPLQPQPPKESQLTPEQRKAVNRIMRLITDHFHRGLVTLIYRGLDDKLRVQVISNANSEAEAVDLAKRTVQEVERSTSGIISTLTEAERRIVE